MRLCKLMGIAFSVLLLAFQFAISSDDPATGQTKDEQLRENMIEQAKLDMELARTIMERKEKDWQELKRLAADDIVTAQEVNQAEEAYKVARAEYEKATLALQRTEIESMRDAWHITIREATRREMPDGRDILDITIRNDSRSVRLAHTSEILGKDVVVSAQINDVFVSIKDRTGAIIAQPYEIRIPTLPTKEERSLQFELLKEEEQDVVVELKYLDMVEERNLHLKQEEPYISVIRAKRYKDMTTGKRRLEIELKYGAVEENLQSDQRPASTEATATEINNIYVSIRDETDAIMGTPYEIKIPSLKYHETVTLDYELRKNTNNVVVHMRYLDRELKRSIYLEPDTRHISIISAIKLRRDNNIFVRLTLQNTTKGELPSVNATPEEIAAANEIRGVYVSLLENDVIIAQPYEHKIDVLGYDETKTLEFQLQRDVDYVTVSLDYKDSGIESRKVYLQKESAEDVVNVSSLRFSQEGELGSSVSYDLLLDRLAENEKTFQLRVINLIDKISFEFIDSTTNSRMSQVKFTMEDSKRRLFLTVHLPEELDVGMLDQKLVFYVAVLDGQEAARLGGENNRLYLADDQIRAIKGGVERLELVPKGVPEFELSVPYFSYRARKGETIEVSAKLKNTGTRDLNDIRVEVTAEPDWTVIIEPLVVVKLARGEETTVKVSITPPVDTTIAEYETRINAYCNVDNRRVEAVEKTIRIAMISESKISVTGILIGLIVLVIVGMVVLTVRVARR